MNLVIDESNVDDHYGARLLCNAAFLVTNIYLGIFAADSEDFIMVQYLLIVRSFLGLFSVLEEELPLSNVVLIDTIQVSDL